MGDESNDGRRNVLAAEADGLGKAIRKMIRVVEGQAEQNGLLVSMLERVDLALQELRDRMWGLPGAEVVSPRRVSRRNPGLRAQQDAEAEAGVTVRIVPCADGRFLASFNGRASVRLSRQLGALLSVLAMPVDGATDGPVPFRSKSEIARELRARFNVRTKAAHVAQAIDRLCRTLRDLDENDRLVQRNRALGYRLGVREHTAPVTGDEG
jgi:hypothetical protein